MDALHRAECAAFHISRKVREAWKNGHFAVVLNHCEFIQQCADDNGTGSDDRRLIQLKNKHRKNEGDDDQNFQLGSKLHKIVIACKGADLKKEQNALSNQHRVKRPIKKQVPKFKMFNFTQNNARQ
jgi:hypothetical protein